MCSLSGEFEYPCETEPIRDLPTARLVVSAVNRSTLTRVSSRSEISASVLTSQGREITVDHSRLLSSHTLRNRVVQSFSSPISLCTHVQFLSGYQQLDYASATSLRKNGSMKKWLDAINTASVTVKDKDPVSASCVAWVISNGYVPRISDNGYQGGRLKLPYTWEKGDFYQATKHWEALGIGVQHPVYLLLLEGRRPGA